jgi:hypothetical protein
MGFRQAKGIYANLDKRTPENGVESSISEQPQTTELLLEPQMPEVLLEIKEEILEEQQSTPKMVEEDIKIIEKVTKTKKVTVPKDKS